MQVVQACDGKAGAWGRGAWGRGGVGRGGVGAWGREGVGRWGVGAWGGVGGVGGVGEWGRGGVGAWGREGVGAHGPQKANIGGSCGRHLRRSCERLTPDKAFAAARLRGPHGRLVLVLPLRLFFGSC